MSLEATHPQYDVFIVDWTTMSDLYRGERAVKAKETEYLPATPGMLLDGMLTADGSKTNKASFGYKVYKNYLARAVFPEYIADAVEILVGMMHHKPATIELPAAMEPLREKATLHNESLQALLRRINTEQVLKGRIGLLADMPENPDQTNPLPYIASYVAESVINWDEADDAVGFSSLNLVVLNESGFTRQDDFTWKTFKRFRVLQLGDIKNNEPTGEYKMGVFDDKNSSANLTYTEALMKAPVLRGKTLKEVPFVFVNTRDLISTPDESPLAGLARLVLAIYRGEADYRQGLFLTGQDTLVVIGESGNKDPTTGEDKPTRVGAGSKITVEQGGDAKYIGVNSQGLPEQRQALEADRKRAETKSGQLINAKSKQESGEALSTRLTAQTASLNQIALTGALGLQTILRKIAVWMGLDPETVKVKPNLEFGEIQLEVADLDKMMDARTKGFPLSKKSMHQLAVDRRLTTMTFEEEMEQIKEEDADMPRTAAGAATVTADEQLQQQETDRELQQQNADADRKLAEKAAAQKASQQKSGGAPK
jgi:hypothetical protein